MAHVHGQIGDVRALGFMRSEAHSKYAEMYERLGSSVDQEINNILGYNMPFGSIYANGILMGVGAVRSLTDRPGEFQTGGASQPLWILSTALETHPRLAVAMLRNIDRLLHELLDTLPRQDWLESWVWTEYPMGHKFAKACGFTVVDQTVMQGDMAMQRCYWERPKCVSQRS